MKDLSQQVLSSLPLEILLYFNKWYTVVYVIIYLALFVYKAIRFPYPPTSAFAWEVTFILMYSIIDFIRLFQASKGNKTEHVSPLAWSIILAVPVAVCNAYYFQLQTYVLRIDVILNAIALSFVGLETLLGILTCISFSRANRF